MTTFTGSTWAPWTNLGQPPGGPANDLMLLGNANNTVWLAAIGADNCTVYPVYWNGSGWESWFAWLSCFKQIASFNTSDGGAYLTFIGTANNYLYTVRFDGSSWGGLGQKGSRTWIATAGVNIDEDFPYEHTESADDCRVQPYTNGPVCDNFGNCFWTQGVNLAEVIYNEAAGETPGAQDTVGWTVRDRAFQGLSCDSYPGGVNWHTSCSPQPCQPCSTLPCNQSTPDFCTNNNTKWYCCAIHGGQTQWGTSGYQFNDEHVDINTLVSSGVMDEALWVGNGLVPDVSTNWCPPGVGTCHTDCAGPWSDGINFNFSDPSPNGPMEFRGNDYCAAGQSCKRYTADVCGNSGGHLNPDSPCGQTAEKNDNFFWNRR